MDAFADNLARLRVAAVTGNLPPDVACWAIDVIVGLHLSLARVAPYALRLEARNSLLRAAGAEAGGSRWAQAVRVARELRAVSRGPALRERVAGDDRVRELVARAAAVGPALPEASVRHLFRLLGEG